MSTYHRGPANLICLVGKKQPMVREDGHPKLPDITAWKLDRDRMENRWISNIKMMGKARQGPFTVHSDFLVVLTGEDEMNKSFCGMCETLKLQTPKFSHLI